MARITSFPKDLPILNQELLGLKTTQSQLADLQESVANLTTLPVLTGNGSPEGVIFATPGSIYLNLIGGSSATLWVKESGGATASGWVAK